MRKRIASAAVLAALFGLTSGALAVAEAEPEKGASDAPVAEAEPEKGASDAPAAEATTEGEPMAESDAMTGDAAAAGLASPDGRVARSAFTSVVVDREPTDALSTLTNDVEEVAYFTELRDFTGSTVVHRWSYDGEVRAEVPFEVGGPRWRVHSSKQLDPSALGEWSVSVVADGQVVATEKLRYTDAPDAASTSMESDAASTPAETGTPAPPASEAPATDEGAVE